MTRHRFYSMPTCRHSRVVSSGLENNRATLLCSTATSRLRKARTSPLTPKPVVAVSAAPGFTRRARARPGFESRQYILLSIIVVWCQARRVSCQAVSGKLNRGQCEKKSRGRVARVRSRNQRRDGGAPAVLAHRRGRSGASSHRDSKLVKRDFENNFVVGCGARGTRRGRMRWTPDALEIGGEIAC